MKRMGVIFGIGSVRTVIMNKFHIKYFFFRISALTRDKILASIVFVNWLHVCIIRLSRDILYTYERRNVGKDIMNLFVQNLCASQFPRTHNDPRDADEIKFRSFSRGKKKRRRKSKNNIWTQSLWERNGENVWEWMRDATRSAKLE